MDFHLLFSARDYLKIKKHTPGTLKLGINPAIMTVPGLAHLKTPGDLPKGILSVDLSIFTMSATIEYDPALIAPDTVNELLTTSDAARGAELLAELDQSLGIGLA